jgi:hypothetical protein
MEEKNTINFAALASGTPLITPVGAGKLIAYKKGNFKNQNVLVEDAFGKRRWYPEEVLRLADVNATAAPEASRIAFAKSFFAYDF